MNKVYITTDFIKLQQALKLSNTVSSGSDAKLIIQEGFVSVNSQICTMRGKKLYKGDVVRVSGEVFEDNNDIEFEIDNN